jgi:hypothetical protein
MLQTLRLKKPILGIEATAFGLTKLKKDFNLIKLHRLPSCRNNQPPLCIFMTLNLLTQNLINLPAHLGIALSFQPPRTLGFPLRNPLLLKKHVSPCQLLPPRGSLRSLKSRIIRPLPNAFV